MSYKVKYPLERTDSLIPALVRHSQTDLCELRARSTKRVTNQPATTTQQERENWPDGEGLRKEAVILENIQSLHFAKKSLINICIFGIIL